MRTPFFKLVLFYSLISPGLNAQTLTSQIDALIAQKLPRATVGVLVKDAQTGEVIYSKNADKLLSPASNIKLFTAAAVYYQLAPNINFPTTLSKGNNNIYLTFSGSPSLKINQLNDLLLNLKKNNIKTITGDFVLDVSHFKDPNYPNGVSYDDLGWYYSAPDTAIMLNKNAETYELTSAKKMGDLVILNPKKPEPQITIINQVVSADRDQIKNHCTLNLEVKEHNVIRLFGCAPYSEKPQELQLAITDPLYLAQKLIKKSLEQNGILLKGHIVVGTTPLTAQPLAQIPSDTRNTLVKHMLQESDNLYANSLTKQLGFALTKEGSHKQGMYALKKALKEHTNLNMDEIQLEDGFGSRYNLISPEQLVSLLTNIYINKNMYSFFLTALPQSGQSGTLKDRMKKTILEKNVFAKTGTMHDISSLSGFLIKNNTNTLIFSIIINGINIPIAKTKSLEEQILMLIAQNKNHSKLNHISSKN
ncbi:MAG: D-alanyl-D-alanine carboxypeptidase/D-alanyl-D-alanine-endopeptidase [bacterium]|nr:D-alanyl-D-alanine carboxypeptidase/D-alanyl-D-alanine-endopeptidase [bacterium]